MGNAAGKQQEVPTIADTKKPNDKTKNMSNDNVEDRNVTVEDENAKENLLKESKNSENSDSNKNDTNSISDATRSTPLTGEIPNRNEDENAKENLLKENKNSENSNDNKNDTNSINDATRSAPSTGEILNRKATVEDENTELKENKSSGNSEDKNDTNLNNSSTLSTGEILNRKATVEDENTEGNLLKENKSSGNSEDKNDTNLNNDAIGSTPSTGETGETGETVDIAIPTKKKKKKKKKKKSGAGDDTGLDFHDSGPREADEDKLYDPSKPLTYRIEVAVQKYKKNRKFSSTRNQVFNSYLRFGGISTGPKSFLGQDGHDNDDADAEEIAARRATDFVDDETVEDMEVNFTYIVRVYLSSFLIDKSGYVQMDQFREGPQVVISFLNYLFNHKVCPEYEDDMQKALQFAHRAKDELPNCKALAHNAPGKFNKACSLLFGGELYGMLDNPWNEEKVVAEMIGISKEEGKRLIEEVFGANAFEELTRVKEDFRNALTCEIIGIEPFQINMSESSTNENHNTSTNGTQNNNGENSAVNDESPHSNNNTQETNLKKIVLREYDVSTAEPFYISVGSDVGDFAMPGMRITADFHKLSNGFWYWDKVTNVYPSYYQPCEDDSDDDD